MLTDDMVNHNSGFDQPGLDAWHVPLARLLLHRAFHFAPAIIGFGIFILR